MKTALILPLLLSLACHNALSCPKCKGHALKCHICVAANEDECNKQGSAPCPMYSDACSTITGPDTVMKLCAYKAFCDKAYSGTTGTKMECCFNDDCNGPHRSHSHGGHNGAGALASSPAVLLGALVLRVALTWL